MPPFPGVESSIPPWFVVLVGAYLVLVVCVSVLAHRAGRNWLAFGLLSAVFSPILGMIVLKIVGPSKEGLALNGRLKQCPSCAEFVKNDAIKCRFCGSKLFSGAHRE